MLVIRNAQMDVFKQEAQARFEDELVELFLKNYPRECRQAGGKDQIRKLVGQGVKAAAARGYTTKRQAGVFVALMFILGADFAHDPQLSWVADLMDEGVIADRTMRLDNLFQETLNYLGATAGENAELMVRAMLRVRAFDLSAVPNTEGGQWITDVCERLKRFYPQKFAFQGEEATRLMILESIAKANTYGLYGNLGIFVYAELVFMLGSGFDRDPLHPWAEGILNDVSITDETERANRLYGEALSHLEQSLSS